jgi:hypothetical protein
MTDNLPDVLTGADMRDTKDVQSFLAPYPPQVSDLALAARDFLAKALQLLSPVLYSREGTVEKIVRTIHEQRVQFATFPETVIPTIRTSRSSSLLSGSFSGRRR